jgi:hypothetical protein
MSSVEMLMSSDVGLLMHWSDFALSLDEAGIETETVFLNSVQLRHAVDRESGFPESTDDATHLLNRLIRTQPSVVLFSSYQGYRRFGRLVREVSRNQTRRHVRVGFHATFSGNLRLEEKPDFVLAATPGIQRTVMRYGAPTHLWYLQLPGRRWIEEPEVSSEKRSLRLSFIGNTGLWDARYQWRAWVLGSLADQDFPLRMFHYGPRGSSGMTPFAQKSKRSRKQVAGLASRSCRSLVLTATKCHESPFRDEQPWFPVVRPTPDEYWRYRLRLRRWRHLDIHPSAPGLLTEARLADSRVTVNAHGDSIGDVGNMRMFEATASGVCLLSDSGPNMSDLYEEDKEVVTYSSVDEAVEKARFLLDNPMHAEAIAGAAQRRYLASHTPLVRARELVATGLVTAR